MSQVNPLMELIVTPNLIQVHDQFTSWLYFHISETSHCLFRINKKYK